MRERNLYYNIDSLSLFFLSFSLSKRIFVHSRAPAVIETVQVRAKESERARERESVCVCRTLYVNVGSIMFSVLRTLCRCDCTSLFLKQFYNIIINVIIIVSLKKKNR